MGLHPDFPTSPFDIIHPHQRWFPSNDNLQELSEDKLRPPLVQKLREVIHYWRKKDYPGASPTSQALLNWWFIETKGREDRNDPLKLQRLKAWCHDATKCDDVHRQGLSAKWDFVFVKEEDFRKYGPSSFQKLLQICSKN